ncbi:hypothetical protein FKM82_003259 [Ascaphus truei]
MALVAGHVMGVWLHRTQTVNRKFSGGVSNMAQRTGTHVSLGEEDYDDTPYLSDSGDDAAWEDDEPNPIAAVLCLFCERLYHSAEETFSHCKSEHQFNIGTVFNKYGLDFYGFIKLINFIRSTGCTAESLRFCMQPPPWDERRILEGTF